MTNTLYSHGQQGTCHCHITGFYLLKRMVLKYYSTRWAMENTNLLFKYLKINSYLICFLKRVKAGQITELNGNSLFFHHVNQILFLGEKCNLFKQPKLSSYSQTSKFTWLSVTESLLDLLNTYSAFYTRAKRIAVFHLISCWNPRQRDNKNEEVKASYIPKNYWRGWHSK